MRKFTLDNRKVICPNASLLGDGKRILKRGDCFAYCDANGKQLFARSLGRISSVDSDGDDCRGWIHAMVLGSRFVYIRWINPADVESIYPTPTKLSAFFFSPDLPYSGEEITDLIEYGTLSEYYMDKVPERILQFRTKK
jgi:hypothetical protein